MSKAAVLTLAVLLALVLAASAPLVRAQPALATDPHVAAMLARVDPAALYQAVGDLSGEWPATIGGEPYTIRTRHTTSSEGLLKATQYAGERLEALGLEVEYHTWAAGTPPNVIGELPGAGGAEEAIILCGHLDDMPAGPEAPGADDNASGSAAVLAAAAILSEYTWTCDLRFALWTGEEQGLLGSRAYAARARSSDDQILAVVNLDMIAYNSAEFPAPVLDLHADSTLPETVDLAHLFDGVVDAYGLALEPKVMVDDSLRTRSDSWAFVEQDYPAILAIEDYDDFSPYYHTVADRLSTLDLAYYAEFVRAVIATVAHAGCFPRGGLMGHVYDASTEAAIPGAAVTLEDSLGITYAVSSDGTGAYALEAMAGVYTATVSPPGYLPGLLGGVVVPTDTIGIQDLALTPIGPLDWRIYLPFVGHSGR